MVEQDRAEKPDYGNWVATRLVYVPAAIGLIFAGLAVPFPLLAVLAAIFLLIALYFAYARYLFSPQGRNVQNQIRGLVAPHLEWDGEGQMLDIGCGSGALAIELAKKYPRAQVTGIDHWGGSWEYSREVCARNAEIEGVSGRVAFEQGSAAALPFADETFDAVVSNLTFHEVGGVKDKKELIREALRVLKKGGPFTFQDLFLWKQVYGEPQDLVRAVKSWGVSEVELINTSESSFIPAALKLPFMAGTIGILAGRK